MPTQKARVFVVYFLYLLKYFFKILYEKRKKGSEKKKPIYFENAHQYKNEQANKTS